MKKFKVIYITLLIVSFVIAIFWVTQVGIAQDPDPDPDEYPMGTQGEYFPNEAYTVTLGAWRNIRPTESLLRRISMLPPEIDINCQDHDQKSKGWIVGDSGVILGYCNGVWDHSISVESIPTNLYDVQAIAHDLAVAVGDQGAILHYLYDQTADDWVWTKSPLPVTNQLLYAVSMAYNESNEKYTGWAVGWKNSNGRGTIVRGEISPTIRNGHDTFTYIWTDQTSLYPSLPDVKCWYDIEMLSPTDGWAVGGTDGENGVFIHWNGSTWSQWHNHAYGTNPIRSIHMISPSEGWAVGYGGVIYRFNGTDWSTVPSHTNTNLFGIDIDAEGILWAVGNGGVILKYINGDWSLHTDLRTDLFDYRDVDFNSGHGWLVGINNTTQIGGQILEYDDDTWYAVTPPTDNRLNDVSLLSENDAWAVGNYDSSGGTIIRWDGKHWQRWYQHDMPIPSVNLYAIDMTSHNDGWAAGDPKVAGGPAVFLHWDGRRWAETREKAPVNVTVTSLKMLNKESGWAVANGGNAEAKWNASYNYWRGIHTCNGIYYQMRDIDIVDNSTTDGDAWAVGRAVDPAFGEYFLRYTAGCGGGNGWIGIDQPDAPEGQPDGATATTLRGVSLLQGASGAWGYAVGEYINRACIYNYSDTLGYWSIYWCEGNGSKYLPSRLYSTDIIDNTGDGWFGGFYYEKAYSRKLAYIRYKDWTGLHWATVDKIYPLAGTNVYHRPILRLRMDTDTMGWAVGASKDDVVDNKNISVIYQYPYPNYTLDINPPVRVVMPGETASYTVTVNSLGGFDSDVTLEIPSTPAGISSSIVPTMTNRNTFATVNLGTAPSQAVGEYNIPLHGESIFVSGDNNMLVERTFTMKLFVTLNPIYSIVPSHGPAGTVVTINGTGFGTDPGPGNRSTGSNCVIWAGIQLDDSNILSWSNDQITFLPPDNPSLFIPERFPLVGNVSVVANSNTSNDDQTFQIDNYITGVEAIRGSGIVTGTIYGTSFGIDPGEISRSTFYEHVNLGENWVETYDVLYWSNNVITFTTTSFAPVSMTVTSNGFTSNSVLFSPGGQQVFLPITIR